MSARPRRKHRVCFWQVLLQTGRVHNRFLRELSLSDRHALLSWNLLPLSCRSDIAMLGMLHKITLGLAHPAFASFFPPAPVNTNVRRTRLDERRHDKQFLDRCDGRHSALMQRSLFGLVLVYNLLPRECVAADSVSYFQSCLTDIVRCNC